MNRLELIEILSSSDEEEVLIQVEDVLYEVDDEVTHKEETFDGFYTAYPAAIVLKPKQTDDNENFYDMI